jgi:hypothetical protein
VVRNCRTWPERLRGFSRLAIAHGYVEKNPADKSVLQNPKIRTNPTLPFSPEDMLRVLSASVDKVQKAHEERRNRWRRARGLVFLLRYAGL